MVIICAKKFVKDQTPSPTLNPTPIITLHQTFGSCDDINFSLGLQLIVSNGCGLTDNECLFCYILLRQLLSLSVIIFCQFVC